MLVTNYSENMGPTQTGFQTNTLKSLFDWLALSYWIFDWLRSSSSYQFEFSMLHTVCIPLRRPLLNQCPWSDVKFYLY